MINIVQPNTREELEGVADVNYRVDVETMLPFWTDKYAADYIKNGRCSALEAASAFSEHILAAKDEEKVVGMIVYSEAYSNFEGEEIVPNSAAVNNVYVLPEYRGRGIGKLLLDAVKEKVRDYSAITLYVYEDNEAAKAFYQHYGFRFDGISFVDGVAYKGRFQRMVINI